jgi:hypothetical protein
MNTCTFAANLCGQSAGGVLGNRFRLAGAVTCTESDATMTSCEFTGNVCELDQPANSFSDVEAAGAVVKSGGEVSLVECAFVQNVCTVIGSGIQVSAAGALRPCAMFLEAANCLFGDNLARVAGAIEEASIGGAASCGELSHPTFVNSAFTGNQARLDSLTSGGYVSLATVGGGVANATDSLTLNSCRFTENTGSVETPSEVSLAGGVACLNASPTITSCVFDRNEAVKDLVMCSAGCAIAGGLAFRESSPTVASCTFNANLGDRLNGTDCGGIACTAGSSPIIENSIIAFSTLGVSVYCDDMSSATLTCTDIYGNEGGDWIGCIADQADINGNLRPNPLFCGDLNPDEPLTIANQSPCAPENNPDCGLIGALPVACSITGVDDLVPLPAVHWLYQSYPNPCNPSTTISFDLPENLPVCLTIYTVNGKLVTSLVDAEMPAGRHDIIWDGCNEQGHRVASGMYFYRIETGSFSETKRMVLIK